MYVICEIYINIYQCFRLKAYFTFNIWLSGIIKVLVNTQNNPKNVDFIRERCSRLFWPRPVHDLLYLFVFNFCYSSRFHICYQLILSKHKTFLLHLCEVAQHCINVMQMFCVCWVITYVSCNVASTIF